MAGMRDLANHILAVANQRGIPISNLQLQKIMFFIFGRIVNEHRDDEMLRNMYDLEFRRWGYGPVVEEIYFDYNNFGGRPINDNEVNFNEFFYQYDEAIIQLSGLNPFKMVEITHKLPSWADYQEDIEERNYVPPYQLEDFIREFRRDE